MLEYVSYLIGIPSKMVIFLHGYNGNISDHQYAIDWLREKLQNTLLIIPQAPEISDKNPQKSQWFGMIKYDTLNKRSQKQTSLDEILAIYNLAAPDIKRQADLINEFINEMQIKYQINNSNTYLCGFSQGAMLTIYAALSRPDQLAAAFVFSGMVAGEKLLKQDIISHPPLYLFHGQEDLKVQYKTFSFSVNWLQKHDITLKSKIYPHLAHKICEDEIEEMAQIVNK